MMGRFPPGSQDLSAVPEGFCEGAMDDRLIPTEEGFRSRFELNGKSTLFPEP